ncbi:hypothetical protein [Lentilactobacillus kosonis]|uniref:Snapalysin n=1 Tax=Lentilactobacillus kosonis TaxID=2810561 RepID=A0A401FND8_9LACO|nr:hypothetical protein [Lentilactobacillus kosonis]GAY73905.1 hypothetical protein NBRC111893_2051 [Lentilactobacillus kosonis]
MMKHWGLFVVALLMGLFMAGNTAEATTVKFDSHMITSKNLTSNGVIKYHVASQAKIYNSEIKQATNKWNKALGKKVFVPTTSTTKSRLVITNGSITPGLAGVAEVNSGVVALNSSVMARYSSNKRQAVIIHELGHTLGTKDLYLYPNANLRSKFQKSAIMGGNYSTTIKKFDSDLAKWSLSKTKSVSTKTLTIIEACQTFTSKNMSMLSDVDFR